LESSQSFCSRFLRRLTELEGAYHATEWYDHSPVAGEFGRLDVEPVATSGSMSVLYVGYTPRSFAMAYSGAWTSGSSPADPEEAERQRKANDKSKDLFFEFLDESQKTEFEENGYVTVVSQQKNLYRISEGRTFNVLGLNRALKAVAKYCLQTIGYVPIYDQMLVQKLMLENEEDRFLEKANRTSV